MAGDITKRISFVADVEGIREGLKRLIADIQQMQATFVIRPVFPDGTPADKPPDWIRQGVWGGGGGGGRSTPSLTQANVINSPGSKNPEFVGLDGNPIPRPGSAGSSPQAPADERSHYQQLRQSNSSYQYLELERASRAREQHIQSMTGGQGGSAFIAQKIQNLSSTTETDPKVQGTITSLTKLKEEFDRLSMRLGEVNQEEQLAIANKDETKKATHGKEREDINRTLQAIVEAAGGGGGGGGKKSGLVEMLKREIGMEGIIQALGNVMTGPLERMKSSGAVGATAAERLRATLDISQSDILSYLAKGVDGSAMSAAERAAGARHITNAGRGIQAGILASSLVGVDQVAGTGSQTAEKALAFGGASIAVGGLMEAKDINHQIYSREKAENWRAYMTAVQGSQAAHTMALEEADSRSAMREHYMASTGRGGSYDAMQSVGADSAEFLKLTSYDEQTRMHLLDTLGLTGSRSKDAIGAANLARGTGRDVGEVGSSVAGLAGLGVSDNASLGVFAKIMAQAVSEGFSTSPLNKLQTDAVIAMAAQIGGPTGAAGLSGAGYIMDVSNSLFGGAGGSKVGAVNAAQSFSSQMNKETTATGGLDQYLNYGNAQSVLAGMGQGGNQPLASFLASISPAEIPDNEEELRALGYTGDVGALQKAMFQKYGSSRLQMSTLGGRFKGAAVLGATQLAGGGGVAAGARVKQLQAFASGNFGDIDLATGANAIDANAASIRGLPNVQERAAAEKNRQELGSFAMDDHYKHAAYVTENASKLFADALAKAGMSVGHLGPMTAEFGEALNDLTTYMKAALDKLGVNTNPRNGDRPAIRVGPFGGATAGGAPVVPGVQETPLSPSAKFF